MVRLRLTRFGKKNRPFYRIGVFDARTRRDGRCIEFIGYYDPFAKEPQTELKVETERARHWLSVGAQPSEKVGVLLSKAGVERPPAKKKRKPKKKSAKKSAKA
jgi:small subunit ribosomal protein S16